MAMMRTQISLTERQRRFLDRVARREGRSVAEVLRSFVDKEMSTLPPEDDSLFDIIGIVDSGGTITSDAEVPQTSDQDFSFTDCTSFALLSRLRIQEAFAFDHHFWAAGFVVVP